MLPFDSCRGNSLMLYSLLIRLRKGLGRRGKTSTNQRQALFLLLKSASESKIKLVPR